MPYGRISQVRFEVLAIPLPWAFPAWRGLSADSQCAPTSMVCPGSSSISYVGSWSALCPTAPLNDGTTKNQSPFAQCRRYLHWGDVYRLLGERYPSLIAPTDSFADPVTSPRLRP